MSHEPVAPPPLGLPGRGRCSLAGLSFACTHPASFLGPPSPRGPHSLTPSGTESPRGPDKSDPLGPGRAQMAPTVQVQGGRGRDRKGAGAKPLEAGGWVPRPGGGGGPEARGGRCRRPCSLHSSPPPAASPVLGAGLPGPGGGRPLSLRPPSPVRPGLVPRRSRAWPSSGGHGGRAADAPGRAAGGGGAAEGRRRRPGQARSPEGRSGPPRGR